MLEKSIVRNWNMEETNKKLGISVSEYADQTIEVALANLCDNYLTTENKAYSGRFKCTDGWFSYNIYNYDAWSGYITKTGASVSYSFYRKSGADAVLKKLGESVSKITINVKAELQDSTGAIKTTTGSIVYTKNSSGNWVLSSSSNKLTVGQWGHNVTIYIGVMQITSIVVE